MTQLRLFLALTAVFAVAVPATAAHADTARSGDSAVLSLSAAGKHALKARGVTVSAVTPATSGSAGLRLPARTLTVPGATASVELSGALRFRAGKRSLTATALRLSVGATSSSLSARLGSSRLTLFSVRGRATLNATSRSVALTKAKLALTRAATTRLKRSLKLTRAPSAATLGTLTLSAAATTTPTPAPGPAPVVTAPAPAPSATPDPGPTKGCTERMIATPPNSTDWFGCQLPGDRDLKSWTNYIYMPFPAFCSQTGAASVSAFGGAERIDPASAFDHRFPVVDAHVNPDGSATIQLEGAVHYLMPAHGIDEIITSLRIELAPGGAGGQVFADGRSSPRRLLCAPPTVFSGQHVLNLDLSGIVPTTEGGVRRWIAVPATIASDTAPVAGGNYGAGRPWGAFTIAVPAP